MEIDVYLVPVPRPKKTINQPIGAIVQRILEQNRIFPLDVNAPDESKEVSNLKAEITQMLLANPQKYRRTRTLDPFLPTDLRTREAQIDLEITDEKATLIQGNQTYDLPIGWYGIGRRSLNVIQRVDKVLIVRTHQP